MPFFSHKKTRKKRALSNVHVCYSPRGTALRSVPELKQFLRQKAITFLSIPKAITIGLYKINSATFSQCSMRLSQVLKLHSGCASFSSSAILRLVIPRPT
ncbi:hypothetical protein BW73_03520 [Escherichia coli O111:NM str. 01-3076]|nr:hypothetical protein BW73_03520 [Escherichia coli O111:NM str. 01-3076]